MTNQHITQQYLDQHRWGYPILPGLPLALDPDQASTLFHDLPAVVTFVGQLAKNFPDDGLFRCRLCRGKPSPNPHDVAENYCAHCHLTTGDPLLAAVRLTLLFDHGLRGDAEAASALGVDPDALTPIWDVSEPGLDGQLRPDLGMTPLQWAWLCGTMRARQLTSTTPSRTICWDVDTNTPADCTDHAACRAARR